MSTLARSTSRDRDERTTTGISLSPSRMTRSAMLDLNRENHDEKG
jgi:hypothetical protein